MIQGTQAEPQETSAAGPRVHPAACGCPAHEGVGRPSAAGPPDSGPIVVMRQPLEPFIAAALDAVPPERLPNLRLTGTLRQIKDELPHALVQSGLAPQWLADWLCENVLFQARLYAELAAAAHLTVRLETVTDDACRRFHTDNVRSRLVCTYRGPGTEYIDPRAARSAEPGLPIDPASIRQLERGAIALMRGGKDATAERPGLVHRSPQIEGTGLVRLFLAIEA